MKALRTALLASALLLPLSGTVAPTFAAGKAASAPNPSQTCADNTITVQFGPGPNDSFQLAIPSHGGCVSTVASRGSVVAGGDYSHAAFVAQCKLLKSELPAELWNAPVDIEQTEQGPSNIGGFGGKIETCTDLLEAYHSGTLSHPE